ncbi:MAG: hypothetical protein NT090_10805, partial [Acidobacteria bacterium]|nr:hypothetical protein [Acidobacteriota bacterium]
MSRAPAPIRLPIDPAVAPDRIALASPPPRPGWSGALVWLPVLALVALAAGYGWRVRTKEAARSAPIVVRSATVGGGIVERTIRLTGVTAAENAVALTAPQLFGSRSFGGGHGDFNLLLQELAPAGSFVNKGDQV